MWRVVPSCFPSPLRTEKKKKKKEEINDVQLEQLVRYKGELPGWECGQAQGWVSGGNMGNLLTWRCRGLAVVAPVVKPKAGGVEPDGLWSGHANMGCFLAGEAGPLLPLSFGFPQGGILGEACTLAGLPEEISIGLSSSTMNGRE